MLYWRGFVYKPSKFLIVMWICGTITIVEQLLYCRVFIVSHDISENKSSRLIHILSANTYIYIILNSCLKKLKLLVVLIYSVAQSVEIEQTSIIIFIFIYLGLIRHSIFLKLAK